MRPSLLLLAAALVLTACEPKEDREYAAATKQAEKTVRQSMGPSGGSAGGGELELRWVVRNQVKGEEIVCAYAAPKETPKGQRPTVTPVIIRAGKTIKAADVGAEVFSRMQDELCGPDWVKGQP